MEELFAPLVHKPGYDISIPFSGHALVNENIGLISGVDLEEKLNKSTHAKNIPEYVKELYDNLGDYSSSETTSPIKNKSKEFTENEILKFH